MTILRLGPRQGCAPGSDATIAARIDRVPTGRFHVRLAAKLALGTFFDGFDAISLAVVLSLVVATFKISFAEAGTIIAAGYLGQFIGAIVIGGPRRGSAERRPSWSP